MTLRKTFYILITARLLGVLVAGCGGDSAGSNPVPPTATIYFTHSLLLIVSLIAVTELVFLCLSQRFQRIWNFTATRVQSADLRSRPPNVSFAKFFSDGSFKSIVIREASLNNDEVLVAINDPLRLGTTTSEIKNHIGSVSVIRSWGHHGNYLLVGDKFLPLIWIIDAMQGGSEFKMDIMGWCEPFARNKLNIMDKKYIEGKGATERFESAIKAIFRSPKPPKHKPKKGKE